VNWKWIVIFILLLILVIFATQNYEIVEIKFLLWSFKTSRAIIIISTFLIGILTGCGATFVRKSKMENN